MELMGGGWIEQRAGVPYAMGGTFAAFQTSARQANPAPLTKDSLLRYKTILADPPWKVSAGRSIGRYEMRDGKQLFGVTDNAARKLAYPSMTVKQIKALQVGAIAAPDAHLYLWAVNRYVRDAFDVAAAWGFQFSTLLVWAKNPMGGGLGGDAYGLSTEFCLFSRRGSLEATHRIGRSWFNWKRPYKNGYPNHSAKPPKFMEMVELVSPGPRVELFARTTREGWHAWGNEVASDVQLNPAPQAPAVTGNAQPGQPAVVTECIY